MFYGSKRFKDLSNIHDYIELSLSKLSYYNWSSKTCFNL